MNAANLKKFKECLRSNGSVIHENSNGEYEVVRFSTPEGVGVLYKDKRNSISSGVRGAWEAYTAFTHGTKWSAAAPTKRKSSSSHRKLLAVIDRDGPDTPENTVIACSSCNLAVGSMNVKQKIEYALTKRMNINTGDTSSG